jgi:hypothetical protein
LDVSGDKESKIIPEGVGGLNEKNEMEALINESKQFASSFSEPELNLADLINVDDNQETAAGITSSFLLAPNQPATIKAVEPVSSSTDTPFSAPALTGISPFAARPRAPSFDLNALGNAPRNEPTTTPTGVVPPLTTAPTEG